LRAKCARVFDRNTQRALPSAAAPPIGGAVAAARAVPRGLIGVIARVGSHVVVATPEVRYAADTPNSHDVRVAGCGSEPQTRMDDTSFNGGRRECRKTEASGHGDDERELSWDRGHVVYLFSNLRIEKVAGDTTQLDKSDAARWFPGVARSRWRWNAASVVNFAQTPRRYRAHARGVGVVVATRGWRYDQGFARQLDRR
jgi:hypothetical protein